LTGNVSQVDTTTRTALSTKASAGFGANSVAVTRATIASGAPAVIQAPNTTVQTNATISAAVFPVAVSLNAPLAISWDVAGANTVTHANVHLDTVSHAQSDWETGTGKFFGSVETGSSGAYKNDFVAPGQATIFYFVVHVQADGQDYYSAEYKIEVK